MTPIAFEHSVRTHAGKMYALTRNLLGCEVAAAESLREACLAARGALHEHQLDEQPERCLLREAARAALKRLRAMQEPTAGAIRDLLPRFLADGHRAKRSQPSGFRDLRAHATATCVARERDMRDMRDVRDVRDVRACIDRLPPLYREALLLCDVERFAPEDAEAALEVSPARLRTILHRARLALRELLESADCI